MQKLLCYSSSKVSTLEKSIYSKDQLIKDLSHGFLSGVDREGPNTRYPTKQSNIEIKIKKEIPSCDANLLYLKQKYLFEHERGG